MIDHLGLQCADAAAAAAFDQRVFASCGVRALAAPSRDAVDAVFAAARDAGTEILHEPREWPEYHPGYYGVFFRGLHGNNVEAVHHGFPTS